MAARRCLPRGLQAGPPGHREIAQQADRRLEPGPGPRAHGPVVDGGRLRPHPGRRPVRPGRGVEVVGVVEDVALQAAERRARIGAELLDQQRARAAQDGERVALAAGAVEREGQQPPGVLAPGVLGHVRVQVRHRLGGQAEGQPRPGPALDGVQPEFGQAGAFRAGPRLVGELGVGGPPPPAERLGEPVEPVLGGQRRGGGHRLLEPPGVHRVRLGVQRVPRPLRDQQPGGRTGRTPGFQRAAQRGHEGAHRAHRPGRRIVPQILDQPGQRDDAAAGDDQPGQHRAVPRPLQGDRVPGTVPGRHRSEHPEHDRHPSTVLPGAFPMVTVAR